MASSHGVGPDQPGWQPPPANRTNPGYGAYGHGPEFGADIFALYRAGRIKLPAMASKYSSLTSSVHDFQQQLNFLGGSVGNERAFTSLESIRELLQYASRSTTQALEASGETLVAVADEFLRTDEEARDKFDHLMKENLGGDAFDRPSPVVPDPPGTNSPFQTPYEPPSLEAPKHGALEAPGFQITGSAEVR